MESAVTTFILGVFVAINAGNSSFYQVEFGKYPQIFTVVGLIGIACLLAGIHFFLQSKLSNKTGKVTSIVKQQNQQYFQHWLSFDNSFLIQRIYSSFKVVEQVTDTRGEEPEIINTTIYQSPIQKHTMPVSAISLRFTLPEGLPESINMYNGSVFWILTGKVKFFGILSAKYAISFSVKREDLEEG